MSTVEMPSVEESLRKVGKGDPVYMRWQDYRRAFAWRVGAERPGENRLEYPAIEAPLVKGRVIVVPAGNAAPEQVDKAGAVFLAVEGETEFTVAGERYALKPLDLLSIPAGTRYSYMNVGLTNALLCGIFAKPDPKEPSAAPTKPIMHMAWAHYRRDFHWTLPLAERWGYHRGSGPLIIADDLRGHTVRIPTGQTTPWHYAARDMLFMGISNEVEFKAGGGEWPLGPLDWLIVPAGTPYTYTNYALAECVFFSIGGKLPPGRKGTYFASDPGWPIRADAETMDVEIDAHGDARVIDKPRTQ